MQGVAESSSRCQPDRYPRGYGATAARLTPDQKVGSSNLSGLKFVVSVLRHVGVCVATCRHDDACVAHGPNF